MTSVRKLSFDERFEIVQTSDYSMCGAIYREHYGTFEVNIEVNGITHDGYTSVVLMINGEKIECVKDLEEIGRMGIFLQRAAKRLEKKMLSDTWGKVTVMADAIKEAISQGEQVAVHSGDGVD